MALSQLPKGLNSGILVVSKGTDPTPVSYTIEFSQGDFSGSGIREGLREQTPVEVRGNWLGNVAGGRAYPTGSFSCVITQISSATDGTIADFFLRNGSYAANVSSKGAGHPYLVNLAYTIDGTDFDSEPDQTFGFQHCEITSIDFSEGIPSTLSFSWTSRGDVSGDLAASES